MNSEPTQLATAGCPHALQARLRAEGPISRIALPDGAHAWLITRHEDVRAALADPRLSLDRANSDGGWVGFSLPPALDANLLNMDPPGHTRLRRLAAAAFTPRRTAAMRGRIQQAASALVSSIAAKGRADLIAELAAPLPVAVICDLLGIPQERRGELRGHATRLLSPDPAEPAQAAHVIHDISQFLADLVTAKRAEPQDDLLSDLIASRDQGDRLTEDELTSLAFLLLYAGIENAVNLIGNTLAMLLTHPGQLERARADPSLLEASIEETLRFEPPAPLAIRRFPTQDITIGPAKIPAGETVLAGIASANRDPAITPDPDTYDITRPGITHLSFGHGPHYCPGAALARLEARLAIETAITQLPGLRLAPASNELRWRSSLRTRTLAHLPVTTTGKA